MTRRVHLSTELEAPIADVLAAVARVDTLRHLTRGLLAIDADGGSPLPERWPMDGAPVVLRVRPFHLPVGWRHTIRVVEADATGGVRTDEGGGIVRRWSHTIRVEPLTPRRCRYTDTIDIDAGVLTLPVWAWASVFYRVRQHRWRHLAMQLARDARTPRDPPTSHDARTT